VGMRGPSVPSSARKECERTRMPAPSVYEECECACVCVVLKNVYKLMPIFFEKRPLSQPVSQ
jgi:hypothetical protein